MLEVVRDRFLGKGPGFPDDTELKLVYDGDLSRA
jgi:hypothetical protein